MKHTTREVPSDSLQTHLSRRRALGAAAGVSLALAGDRLAAARQGTPAPGATPVAESVSVLFVQSAASGTMTAKEGAEGVFELTLAGVSAQTIWFSDRPAREAGVIDTSTFAIDPVFDPINPPNAAVVVQTDSSQDTLIVELTSPRYDAAGDTATYDATPIATYADEVFTRIADQQEDTELPASFGLTSVLIDEVACQPDGTICNDRSQCCSGFCTPLAAFPPLTCLTP
jgi:hypothetical protein